MSDMDVVYLKGGPRDKTAIMLHRYDRGRIIRVPEVGPDGWKVHEYDAMTGDYLAEQTWTCKCAKCQKGDA